MREKILALLAEKFQGARKDGLEQLARGMALHASTEKEAAALVEKLTEAQVGDFVKEYRADVDREATTARDTYERNLKKKFDFVEKKKPEEAPAVETKKTEAETGDIAAIVRSAVTEAVKPFQDELAGFKADGVAKTRLQSLNDKLNGCKDGTFKAKVLKDFARMKFETEDEFTEYLSDTEKDVAKANQGFADTSLGRHGAPLMTGVQPGIKEASKDEMDAVIERIQI